MERADSRALFGTHPQWWQAAAVSLPTHHRASLKGGQEEPQICLPAARPTVASRALRCSSHMSHRSSVSSSVVSPMSTYARERYIADAALRGLQGGTQSGHTCSSAAEPSHLATGLEFAQIGHQSGRRGSGICGGQGEAWQRQRRTAIPGAHTRWRLQSNLELGRAPPSRSITQAKGDTLVYSGPVLLDIAALLCLALPLGIKADKEVPAWSRDAGFVACSVAM